MSKYVANNVASVGNTLLTDPESVFYSAVHAAEATFQAANKSTAALLKAADIAKHRAIVQAAAVAGNSGPAGHLGGMSRAALMELGTGGS